MAIIKIDAEANRLAMTELEGQPIYTSADGGLMEAGVRDLAEWDTSTRGLWQPADLRTQRLALAAEACRELLFHGERALELGLQSKRALRALVVPLCNLVDLAIQLQKTFEEPAWALLRQSWPAGDQAGYLQAGRRLRKKHRDGPLRKARDKTAAHLDPQAYGLDLRLSVTDVLGALGDALVVVLLSFNHRSHAFAWVRMVGTLATGERVVDTMFSYPISVRWLTDADGNVLRTAGVRLAADPRNGLQDDVLSTMELYNALVDLSGGAVPYLRAWDPRMPQTSPVQLESASE